MKVVWTEQALQGLSEIEDYIARDAPATAVVFVEKLLLNFVENRGEDIFLLEA